MNVGPLAWAVRVVRREQRPLARASTEMTAVTTRTAATSAGRRRVTGGNDLITLVTAPRAWGAGGVCLSPSSYGRGKRGSVRRGLPEAAPPGPRSGFEGGRLGLESTSPNVTACCPAAPAHAGKVLADICRAKAKGTCPELALVNSRHGSHVGFTLVGWSVGTFPGKLTFFFFLIA